MILRNTKKKYICGIIGFPLKKPRSIQLWKSFFKKNSVSSEMIKFEIAPKNIDSFIEQIKHEKKFLAAAVSMPYKIKLLKFMNHLDDFASGAKSLNLILKKKNKLYGYNTDIYGALGTIKEYLKKFKNIIIIGIGGTGKAMFNYLYKRYPDKNFQLISKSTKFKGKNVDVYKKINKNLFVEKKLIINCSPLGSDLKTKFINQSPIKKKLFSFINKSSVIFDVIYSPKKTLMSKYAKKNKIKYFNGIYMNTLQAKKSLKIIFKR